MKDLTTATLVAICSAALAAIFCLVTYVAIDGAFPSVSYAQKR